MIQILIKLILFKNIKNLQHNDCWSKALRYTDSAYVRRYAFLLRWKSWIW